METKQENIVRTDYSEIMQKSYIDYAMSVIISRALPDVRRAEAGAEKNAV